MWRSGRGEEPVVRNPQVGELPGRRGGHAGPGQDLAGGPDDTGTALPRQFALLVVVWIHGSIGIHMWLRFRPWYPRVRAGLAAAALLLPLFAILGIINAGWDPVLRAAVEPGFAAAHGPPAPGTPTRIF